MQARLYRYDLLRVIAMTMVVAVHCLYGLTADRAWVYAYNQGMMALLLTANMLFFAMSGRFNLKERTDESIPHFYIHKIISVLLPVLIYMFLQAFNEYLLAPGAAPEGVIPFIKYYVKAVLGGYGSSVFWFIMALFGFLLAAPFLGHITARWGKHEKRAFIVLGLLFNAATWVFSNTGIKFTWGWMFGVALWFYMMGGMLSDDVIDNLWARFKGWLVVGVVLGWAATVAAVQLGWASNAYDYATPFMIFSLCLYISLLGATKNAKPCRLVSWAASFSFGVYMIHMLVIFYLRLLLPDLYYSYTPWGHMLTSVVVLVLATLAAALIDSTVVSLVQTGIRKLVSAISNAQDQRRPS